MPAQGERVYATQRIRISKTVEAPLSYVYRWCTDFREDDGRFSSSRPAFRVIRAGRDRVARVRIGPPVKGKRRVAAEVVRLRPPRAWHVDQVDEDDLASIDYRLTSLGPRRTRLVLSILERWMTPKHPSVEEYRTSTGRYWDVLIEALQRAYQAGRPPNR